MANLLNQIPQLLDDFFHNDWWLEYDFEKEIYSAELESKGKLFNSRLEELKGKLFDHINASILLGEYVKDNDIESKIRAVIDKIHSIPQLMPALPEIQILLNSVLNINFNECLKIALELYLSFVHEVRLKYKIDNRHFLFNFNSEVRAKLEENDFSSNSREQLGFLNTNIKISDLDHFLTAEVPSFNELFECSYLLVKNPILRGNKYSILLKNKCDYLISKWIARRWNVLQQPLYTIRDNIEIKANPEEFNNYFYPQNKEYIESQYEISSNWKHIVEQDFDEIKRKSLSSLTLKQLHRLIKYYKDVSKDLLNLNKVCEEIEDRYDQSKEDDDIFQLYTYSVALNYSLNNKFSLLLDDPKITEDKIEEAYRKILSIQSATGIRNFFPQFKLLTYWVNKLQVLYNDRKALEFIALKSKAIISKCEQIAEDYSRNVKWSEFRYNYVFQLPYAECLFETHSQELPHIYIGSSFMLPLPRERYKLELEDSKRRIHMLNSSIEIFSNLEKDIEELNKDKEEIQKRDIRSMEILGIFTAIVTFVAGSLPTFQFIKNSDQAALFMLALSTSLAIFVLLVLLVSRGVEKLKKHWSLVVSMLIAACSFWVGLIFLTRNQDSRPGTYSERIEGISDSIKMIHSSIFADSNKSMKSDTTR